MQDLDPIVRGKIDAMLRGAKQFLVAGDVASALRSAADAWGKLPEPKFSWDVSKSYTHAYAKILRDSRDFSKSLALMNQLFESGTVKPHQDGPYFIMGTVYYEMGDMINAKKWLSEANQISRGRCFSGEPEKYKNVLVK